MGAGGRGEQGEEGLGETRSAHEFIVSPHLYAGCSTIVIGSSCVLSVDSLTSLSLEPVLFQPIAAGKRERLEVVLDTSPCIATKALFRV